MHFFQQLVSYAQGSLDRARAYQKKHADKRRRELTFNVGDRVMLSTTHPETTLPSAFRRRYVGAVRCDPTNIGCCISFGAAAKHAYSQCVSCVAIEAVS